MVMVILKIYTELLLTTTSKIQMGNTMLFTD